MQEHCMNRIPRIDTTQKCMKFRQIRRGSYELQE